MALTLTSPAFSSDGTIPAKYTCDGDGTSPPLEWSGVPDTAMSLALVVDDPDAPDPAAPRMRWVHWVVLDLPANARGLREGIRSVADAESVLNLGADKVSINSPALERPDLIDELVRRFGSQCVVIGIDTLERGGDGPDRYGVYQYTGDPSRTLATQRRTLDWVREVEERGAGEIVLNCMNQDGVRKGYDGFFERRTSTQTGGAGAMEHFKEVFETARVDGALAASVFHTAAIEIGELKSYLAKAGIAIRPVD